MLDLSKWRALLDSIKAPLSTWTYSGWKSRIVVPWEVTIRTTGVAIKISDVKVDGNGLFSYEGQRVLIYIKNTRQPEEVLLRNRAKSKRFHFRDCEKIREMKSLKKYQRYVAIARTDGLFPVFSLEADRSNRALEAPLGPCKYCLGEFNYLQYADVGDEAKKYIWERFSVADFFANHPSAIEDVPDAQDTHVVPDGYTPDWQEVSAHAREAARWTCQICSVDLAEARHLLHVHHVNSTKSDNRKANLRVLCLECHRKEPLHGSMHAASGDIAKLRIIKRRQRIA